MKLAERYRPRRLSEIVGQPRVRSLQAFVRDPHEECFLFEGPPGTGKTSAAAALAEELGCDPEWDVRQLDGSELTVDAAKDTWRGWMRLKAMNKREGASGFKVLIIEELEWLSPQCQTFLKKACEVGQGLPSRCIVVATSNGAGKLSRALMERFKVCRFPGGEVFRSGCLERMVEIWEAESGGGPMPAGWEDWGTGEGGEFSMRRALREMEDFLEMVGVAA